MADFVILGTQRTGTTLLKTTLNTHPDIHCAGELFIHRGLYALLKRAYYGKKFGRISPLSYSTWSRGAFGRRVAETIGFGRDTLTEQYLRQLFERNLAPCTGFKLMFNQGNRYPGVVRWCLDKNLKIIHLVRENYLKTLVSRQMTLLQPRAHSRVNNVNEGLKVRLRAHRVVAQLQGIEEATIGWSEIAGESGNYLRVSYEQFVAERDHWLKQIFDHLEVDFRPVTSPLKKLNRDDLSDVIENYDEIHDLLTDTEYGRFLEGR